MTTEKRPRGARALGRRRAQAIRDLRALLPVRPRRVLEVSVPLVHPREIGSDQCLPELGVDLVEDHLELEVTTCSGHVGHGDKSKERYRALA